MAGSGAARGGWWRRDRGELLEEEDVKEVTEYCTAFSAVW
jgi:hypothetical protein